MGTLIALGCLALLAGSVFMLRPSPRERRQSRLRQEALAAGLRVRLQEVRFPGEPEPHRLAAYTLAHEEADVRAPGGPPPGFLVVRAAGGGLDQVTPGWQFLESDRQARLLAGPLGQWLENQPEEVLAVAGSPGAVAVYWTEQGVALTVADIRECLEGLRRLVCGRSTAQNQ